MLPLHQPTPSPASASPSSAEHSTVCGSSTAKRLSSSSFSLPQPAYKKQELASTSEAAEKPQTQITPHGASPPAHSNTITVLRRCVSDPVNSPRTTIGRPGQPAYFLNPQSPENNNTNSFAGEVLCSAPSSPGSPPLCVRPNPVSFPGDCRHKAHVMARASLQSPSSGELVLEESPNSNRLKRIKDRMSRRSSGGTKSCAKKRKRGPEENNHNGQNSNTNENESECAEAAIE